MPQSHTTSDRHAANSGDRTRAPSRCGLAVVYVGFIVTGVVTTLLGPILPSLQASWRLSDQRAGYLFAVQFTASIVGTIVGSELIPRLGFRISLSVGYALMAVGISGLALGTWPLALLAVAFHGAGFGWAIPVSNLLVYQIRSSNRAAALNLLNFAWGVGAVACPLLAGLAQRRSAQEGFLLGVAASAGLIATLLLALRFEVANPRARGSRFAQIGELCRQPFAWMLALTFFLYVGTEASLGGWVADYAKRITESSTSWIFTPSFYWAGLMLGRAVAPLFLRRIRDCTLATAGLALAFLGVLMLIFASSIAGACAAGGLAGLGLASVYPVTIAQLSRLGAAGQRISGAMFAIAGCGGACLPWLIGFVSTHAGSLKAGLLVPLIATASMLSLYSLPKVGISMAKAITEAQPEAVAF